MEKHPIDDLFARKLSGVNREPSTEVWKRLQQERKIETRSVFFRYRWFAAAMVAMFLVAGSVKYAWKIGDTAQMAHVRTDEKHLKQPSDLGATSGGKSKLNQLEAGVLSYNDKKVKLNSKVEVDVKEDISQLALNKSIDEKGILFDRINTEPASNENSTALAVVDEPVNESSHTPKPEEEQIDMEGSTQKEVGRVVVVHVVVDKEDRARPNRFKRMLKQLQNAKEGEKVNWEEMGISTKKIFAHAGNE